MLRHLKTLGRETNLSSTKILHIERHTGRELRLHPHMHKNTPHADFGPAHPKKVFFGGYNLVIISITCQRASGVCGQQRLKMRITLLPTTGTSFPLSRCFSQRTDSRRCQFPAIWRGGQAQPSGTQAVA